MFTSTRDVPTLVELRKEVIGHIYPSRLAWDYPRGNQKVARFRDTANILKNIYGLVLWKSERIAPRRGYPKLALPSFLRTSPVNGAALNFGSLLKTYEEHVELDGCSITPGVLLDERSHLASPGVVH